MNAGFIRERRETDRLLQIVLDNIPMAVSINNLYGRYLFINHGLEQMYRISKSLVLGKTDHDLFPAAQADALCAGDPMVVASRLAKVVEFETHWEDEVRIYSALKFPLFNSNGTPYAVGRIFTDVTEIQQAEHEMLILRRQLWHSDRVAHIGSITASIAHELNQPLAAILSNAQAALRFLDRGPPDLLELRAILEDVVRDDKRAAAVISGLRALMRRQDSPREKFDLRQIVAEVIELMRGELVERGIDCESNLDADCRVHADKTQIQQIVINLMMNAMEAMGERPASQRRLWVFVAPDSTGGARVAVRDSGVGIPAEDLDGVFDAFYTTKASGLGMGLAVCRSIIEAHGGTIWVERNDDCGVTFFFTLPLCEHGDMSTAINDLAKQASVDVA